MHVTTADKRATFRKMHESGCFILPNPVDVGSAKALQHLGFKALASSSAGFAWTIGKADNRVSVEDVCQHLAALSSSVDIPVNADFEGGFAVEPDKVADNVERLAHRFGRTARLDDNVCAATTGHPTNCIEARGRRQVETEHRGRAHAFREL